MDFQWYQTLSETADLQQGDFIPNCPIVIPPKNIQEGGEEINIEVEEINSIILSQSCDLVNNKVDIVLVCRYITLSEFIDNLPDHEQSKRAKQKNIDNLRKGFLPGYHLLNKNSAISGLQDYIVVDFRNVYGVHFSSLTEIAQRLEERVRLLPPYREHLSQAFARYFMRVGLPQDIRVEGY